MNENNYWKQFMNTGKIEDYLLFAGMRTQDRKEADTEQADVGGEKPHGRNHKCDRNGAAGGTYRGI
ncbi:MAG: hypothetical protein IJC59_04405 [Lachnospiraceae bacterium]|nr:hypothetical protein [Lachnospiraceae bacterium]